MTENSIFSALKQEFSITDEHWQEVIAAAGQEGGSLTRVLLDRGLVKEEDLLQFFSRQLHLPFQRVSPDEVDGSVIPSVPAKVATHYHFMPLRRDGEALLIAFFDPLNITVLDELRLALDCEVQIILATRKDIGETIKAMYGLGADTLEKIDDTTAPELEIAKASDDETIDDESIDPSVIKFLNQVLSDAITQRATDIHLEPFENALRIRYRIDGMLHEVSAPPTIKRFQSSIASRIKVMANLDIAEKRRPQDGRIKIRMGEEIFDLRISILPAPFGESIVIRILSRSSPMIGLSELGLPDDALVTLEQAIQKPHGIILVTGPTGSGKTTTLYACLSRINSPQRKILTIEEPIEYQLQGITQMQAEPKIGFTFATALRSMLRHDPDVMMVGEIRDTETAQLSVRTALTGHLVFSTLHTNDSASSITRLMDMGIDAYLVVSSVILVIAQRLVRTICPHCKEVCTPDAKLLSEFPETASAGVTFYRGTGCEQCRFTGYRGRVAIFEMLEITEEIRDLALKQVSSHQIKQKAAARGMKLLRQAGWEKVVQGVTTVEEVLRVTQEDKI